MSLPGEPSPNLDTHTYHNCLPVVNTHHPDPLRWLPVASPLASPAWSPESYTPDKVSSSSSGSTVFTLDTLNCYKSSHNPQALSELPIQERLPDTSLPHLHLSPLESPTMWTPSWIHSSNGESYHPSTIGPNAVAHPQPYNAPINSESPYSTTSPYDESPVQSSYYSSPDLGNLGFETLSPRSLLEQDQDLDCEEDEDGQGGKPYARLIYEALLEAPGHRMMLRDIYDWFEKNTTKPRESGTNGWQNSIRHNLSMNHVWYHLQLDRAQQFLTDISQAFENDKTQTVNARGEPKKATSVWYLTDYALRNGVQSTTRYRKNGGTRRSALHGRPNAVRARSGAKGGRAARRAARFRQKEQSPYLTWASPTPIDDMGAFNQLVNAATTLRDSPPTGISGSPSPVEQQQRYVPSSTSFQNKFPLEMGNYLKADPVEVTFDEFKSQNLFLSEHLGGNLDDSWFPAGQIG
ncbi:hypothetical protein DV738_g3897, partial [Chaetothyriales sp. CBS 135597]